MPKNHTLFVPGWSICTMAWFPRFCPNPVNQQECMQILIKFNFYNFQSKHDFIFFIKYQQAIINYEPIIFFSQFVCVYLFSKLTKYRGYNCLFWNKKLIYFILKTKQKSNVKEVNGFKIQDLLLTSDKQDIDCCIELFFAYLEWKKAPWFFNKSLIFRPLWLVRTQGNEWKKKSNL